MGKTIDMIGQEYSRLTVLEKSNKTDATGSTFWLCKCECGNTKEVSRPNLVKGFVKSCGCLQEESRIKHNMSRSDEYNVWYGIKRRCTDEKFASYKYYGAIGITISEDWLDFEKFLADMGKRPSNQHDIDRIDNNKGYSKDNCRWTTKSANAQNKRNSKRWVVNGVEYASQNEASRETGISASQINRMCKGYKHSRTGKYYPPAENCNCYLAYKED